MSNSTEDGGYFFDDDFVSPKHHNHHHHNDSNFTIKTSVTIRVTPLYDYYTSWSILWGCFVVASLVALWQVIRERKIVAQQTQTDDVEQASHSAGDTESFSTADITRCLFRRLLLLAMLARVIFLPVQALSDPIWWQFVSDTLPEMIFASAWLVLVTFVVQLVGIAMGTGTSTLPGMVISLTAYIVYSLLIIMQYFNNVASVLIYALLCCIYAALFGVVFYFFPRLMALLRPALERHRGLSARIFICTLLCLLVFAAHVIGYARRVVAPPRKVYWWWEFGALELLPSVLFLVLMRPKNDKLPRGGANNTHGDTPEELYANRKHSDGIKRSSSATGRRVGESAALLKQATSYGSVRGSTPPPSAHMQA